ncbi:MAG: META domain-containing protein, partial [Acidimicrobiales bacterium]
VRGTAACNGYGGTIVTGDVLFEGFEVTEMACDPASAMTLESAYLQALSRVTDSEIQGAALVLTGPGVELRFAVVEETADVPLEDTSWLLDTLIDGEAASTGPGLSEAIITFAAGEVLGSDGCNNFSGGYEIDADRIRFGALRQTLKGCPDEMARQTQLIAEVIGSDPVFEIEGEALTLMSPAGAALVYRAG